MAEGALEERSAYCDYCERRVLVRGRPVNNLGNLVLTVCTCGLWFFIWLWYSMRARPWRCTVCGSTNVKVEKR